jgi:hypothetical protein
MSQWRLWGVMVGLLMQTSVNAQTAIPLPNENRILTASLELERRTQPWCPGDCTVGASFVASYRKGSESLVFVGVHHAFQPNDPTMQAVKAGFAEFQAKMVVVEGFPTAMGENPPPLVAEAHRHGAPDADEFARGEAMYAASMALMQSIPFVGGEPTRDEEIQALKAHGFTETDIAFSALAGAFSQALRSGDIPDTSAASLAKAYPHLAQQLKEPTERGGWNLNAPTLEGFQQQYRNMYHVDIVGDTKFPLRIDGVLDTTRYGEQARANMMLRDRHLLGLIEQQLSHRHSVLVVYGGSHWSTLSAALEARLGRPKVRPFLK